MSLLVLLNIRKRTRSSLSQSNIDDEMRRSCQTHDLTSQGDWQYLCPVQPGSGVEHTVVCDDEQIDSENGETFADSVVGVLELLLHHSCVDLNEDDARKSGKNHLATTPLVGEEFGCQDVGKEGECAVD